MMQRQLTVCLLAGLLLTACESDRLPQGDTTGTANGSTGTFDDAGVDNAYLRSLVRVGAARVTGVSHDGDEADLRIDYRFDPALDELLTRNTQLRITREVPGTAPQELRRIAVNGDVQGGTAELTVPTFDASAVLRFELVGLKGELHPDMAGYAIVEPPSYRSVPCTDTSRLTSIDVELVPESYASAIEGVRRVHRFSTRVTGTLEGAADPVSVSCLDREADRHFAIRESDHYDDESGVEVDYEQKSTAVYFVIDGSSSIVNSATADLMIDALSRSVIALAPVADFDYRLFGSQVFHVDSLREGMTFDTPLSGSAVYYALDTALRDIEDTAVEHRDAVVVLFSDGTDLASRNEYPAFLSHAQVRRYITSRIRTVRLAMQQLHGARLDTYFVHTGGGLPADIEQFRTVANDSGSGWLAVPGADGGDASSDAMSALFDGLSDDIRGVYHLVYSSQQTPDDTDLLLEVQVNGLGPIQRRLPNAYPQ